MPKALFPINRTLAGISTDWRLEQEKNSQSPIEMIPSERVTLVILCADSSHGLEPVPPIKSIISPVPVKDSVVLAWSRAHLIVPNVPEVITPQFSNVHPFMIDCQSTSNIHHFQHSAIVGAVLSFERIFSRMLTDVNDTQFVKAYAPQMGVFSQKVSPSLSSRSQSTTVSQ